MSRPARPFRHGADAQQTCVERPTRAMYPLASCSLVRGSGRVTAMDLKSFAEEVGADGPVTVVGGRTQWDVGGAVDSSVREVRAPAGIVEFEPAEMTVRCGAGTLVAELDAAL